MSAGEAALSHAQPTAVAVVLSVKAVAELRVELNRVYLSLNKIGSHVSVAAFALRAQASDIDRDVAAVLDAAACRIEDACTSLENALASLPAGGAP